MSGVQVILRDKRRAPFHHCGSSSHSNGQTVALLNKSARTEIAGHIASKVVAEQAKCLNFIHLANWHDC